MSASDVAFGSRHAADVIRVLFDEVGVQVVDCSPHFVGVFLVNAEDDGFIKAPVLPHKLREVSRDGLGACAEADRPLEVFCVILLVRYHTPVAISLPLVWPPSGRVVNSHDSMDSVRGKEAVLDALLKAVLINGVAEVLIGVFVVLP